MATLSNWVRQYGKDHLLRKVVHVIKADEQTESVKLRKQIRELEHALSTAHIDLALESAYVKLACQVASIATIFLALTASAQMIGPGPGRQANLEAVKRWTVKQRSEAVPTRQVWPGVVADTASRTVTVLAEAVGLSKGGVVEFVLVGDASDRDYEALAIVLAKPSEVALALEAVGVPRGQPVQPRAFRFWPRGERVRLTVRPFVGGEERPLGDYVFDQQARQGMSNIFTYVGSVWHEDGTCEADATTPGSLIATYNAPETVLDMPFAVTQNAAYGRYVVKEKPMARETLWQFVFRPEKAPDAVPRVVPLELTAQPRNGLDGPAARLADVAWVRQLGDAVTTNALDTVITSFMALIAAGREPHVTLRFDDRLSVRAASESAAVIQAIEGVDGIRVDGPPPGQCFFKAFLPNEEWREREKRLMQPYELRVERTGDGGWRRTFVYIHEDWSDESSLDPKLTAKPFSLASWDDLADKVAELGRGLGTLLVFAPVDAPLSAFMPGVRLVQETVPTVYVLAEKAPTAAPK